MSISTSMKHQLILAIFDAASMIERRLDRALSSIKGITFSEYLLLHRLAGSHDATASRVDLADMVGLSPSGVTRALKPLEKIGFVETTRDERDARRSLATLTPSGHELVADAFLVISDIVDDLSGIDQFTDAQSLEVLELLRELG